jgi:hypothetical protein
MFVKDASSERNHPVAVRDGGSIERTAATRESLLETTELHYGDWNLSDDL